MADPLVDPRETILAFERELSDVERLTRGKSFGLNRESFENAIVAAFDSQIVRTVFFSLFASEEDINAGSNIDNFSGFLLSRTSYALQIYLHSYMRANQPGNLDFIRTDEFTENLETFVNFIATQEQISQLGNSPRPEDIATVRAARLFQSETTRTLGPDHYVVNAAFDASAPAISHLIFRDVEGDAAKANSGIIGDFTWRTLKDELLPIYGQKAIEWMESQKEVIENRFRHSAVTVDDDATFIGYTAVRDWFIESYGPEIQYEMQVHEEIRLGTSDRPNIDPILDQMIMKALNLNNLYSGELSSAIISNMILEMKKGLAFDRQRIGVEGIGQRKDSLFEVFRHTLDQKVEDHLRSLIRGSAAGQDWLEAIDLQGIKLAEAFLQKGDTFTGMGSFRNYNDFFDQVYEIVETTFGIAQPPGEEDKSARALVLEEIGDTLFVEGFPAFIRDSVIGTIASRLADALDGQVDLDSKIELERWWDQNGFQSQANDTIRTLILQMDGGDRLLAQWDGMDGDEWSLFLAMDLRTDIFTRATLEEAIQPFIEDAPEIDDDPNPGEELLREILGSRMENMPGLFVEELLQRVDSLMANGFALRYITLEDLADPDGDPKILEALEDFERLVEGFITDVGRQLFPGDDPVQEYAQSFIDEFGVENFFNTFEHLQTVNLNEIARRIFENELLDGVEVNSSSYITDEEVLGELRDLRGEVEDAELFAESKDKVTRSLAQLGIDADETTLNFLLDNPDLFGPGINLLDAEATASLEDRVQALNERRVKEGLEVIDFERSVGLLKFFQSEKGKEVISEDLRLTLLELSQGVEDRAIAQGTRPVRILADELEFEKLKEETEFAFSETGRKLIGLERDELVRQRFRNVFQPELARQVGGRFGTQGGADITQEIGEELFQEFNTTREQLATKGIPQGQPFSQFTVPSFTPEAFLGTIDPERFEGALTSARGRRRIGISTPRSATLPTGASRRRRTGGRAVGIG